MSAAILPILFAQPGNGPPLALIFWVIVILVLVIRNLFRFSAGLVEAINTVRGWFGKEPLGQKVPRLARPNQPEKRSENYAELEEADPLENIEPLDRFGQSAPVAGEPKSENERLREEIRRFQLNRSAPQPPVYEPTVRPHSPLDPKPALAAESDKATPIPNAPFTVPLSPAPPANATSGAFSSAALAESLTNPTDLRKAILLNEILRRPDWE